MSALGDAYKAIESVILLRSRIEGVERSLERLVGELREHGRDMNDIQRRLIRIETLIEVARGTRGGPDLLA